MAADRPKIEDRASVRPPGGNPAGRAPDEGATTRRDFMKLSSVAIGALATAGLAEAADHPHLDEARMGVLVDLTLCIGCRRCEWACKEANGLPHGPLHECDDQSVFETRRRPTPESFTVVNREPGGAGGKGPIHLKVQCMHCERPACVSACLVGAMRKDPKGPVTYDPSRCIGCRYCLVACPFENLSYEYDKALTPRVRKCTFCRERTRQGKVPACVEMCPVEALLYGKRSELLEIAHDRISRHPGKYVDHVYGETEGGGTSWLYLSDRPFDQLGFPSLGDHSPAQLSEAIQHGIFRGFAAPIALAGLLAALGRITHRRAEK